MKLQRVCCRLYPFIFLDNNKEGHGNFSGGRSPHWVNHVYMSLLYCVSYLFYFCICFILFLHDTIFITLITILVITHNAI
jgi:hypothetical protein